MCGLYVGENKSSKVTLHPFVLEFKNPLKFYKRHEIHELEIQIRPNVIMYSMDL